MLLYTLTSGSGSQNVRILSISLMFNTYAKSLALIMEEYARGLRAWAKMAASSLADNLLVSHRSQHTQIFRARVLQTSKQATWSKSALKFAWDYVLNTLFTLVCQGGRLQQQSLRPRPN